MALITEDFVKETTITTGSGPVVLLGARAPGRAFSSVMNDGDTCHYVISHTTINEIETGLGTFVESSNSLARTEVFESTNAGSLVEFSAGTKYVDLTLPSRRILEISSSANQLSQSLTASLASFASSITSSFISASNSITVTSQSINSSIVSSSTVMNNRFASPFVTVGNTTQLPNERSLSEGSAISIVDGGAGSTLTIGVQSAFSQSLVDTIHGISNLSASFTSSLSNLSFFMNASFLSASTSITNTSQSINSTFAAFASSITSSFLSASNSITLTSQSINASLVSQSTVVNNRFSAPYITLATTTELSNERAIQVLNPLTATDGGPGGSLSVGLTSTFSASVAGAAQGLTNLSASITASFVSFASSITASFLSTSNSITLTSQSINSSIASSSTVISNLRAPQFVTLASSTELSNERVLQTQNPLSQSDGGSGGALILGISSVFSSSVAASAQGLLNLSASVTASFNSFASSVTSSFTSASNSITATSQSFVVRTNQIAQSVLNLSASVTSSFAAFASSITSSFTSASNSVTVTSQSINASIVSASTVINNLRTPQFVTLAATGELPNERVLIGQSPVTLSDGGAGSNLTIGLNSAFSSSVAASAQGLLNLSASITASLASFASSITSSFISASNSITLTSQSFVTRTNQIAQSVLNLSASVTASFSSFASSITSSFLSASNSITLTSQSINSSITSASTVINNLRTPQFVVMTTTSELPNERALAVSNPITRTDGGAGSNVTIGMSSVFSSSVAAVVRGLSNLSASITASFASFASSITSSFTSASNSITLTSQSFVTRTNQIAQSVLNLSASVTASFSSFASSVTSSFLSASNSITLTSQSINSSITSASTVINNLRTPTFLTLNTTSELPNERVLGASTGLILDNSGSGAGANFRINDNVVATISGTSFTGRINGTQAEFTQNFGVQGSAAFNGQLRTSGTLVAGSDSYFVGSTHVSGVLTIASSTFFNGAVINGTQQNETGAPPWAPRLDDTTTRLYIIRNGDGDLTEISGTNIAGRNVLVYFVGSGIKTIRHNVGSGASNLLCPDNQDFTVFNRDTIRLTGDGANGWLVAPMGLSGKTIGENVRFTNVITDSTSSGVFATYPIAPSMTQVRCNTSTNVEVRGMTRPVYAGQRIIFHREPNSAGTWLFRHNSGGGITQQQLFLSNETDQVLDEGQSIEFEYNINRWRHIGGTNTTLARYLIAGPGVTLTSGSDLSGSVSISVDASAFVTQNTISNLSASVTASFSSFATSITSSFLSSSNSITLTSQSINSSITSASTVINNLRTPQFVVMTSTTQLPNERALAVSSGLTRTDGGAGSNVTLGIDNSVVATISGTSFTQLSGSLQRLPSGLTYLVGGTNISVSTGSNGQVTIASTGIPVTNTGTLVTSALTLNLSGAMSASNDGSGTVTLHHVGESSIVRLNGSSGNLGTIDISNLACGGTLAIVAAAADYSIEGFTSTPAKPDGFWFTIAASNTSVLATIFNEDSTASASDRIRIPGNGNLVTTNLQATVHKVPSDGLPGGQPRWRLVCGEVPNIVQRYTTGGLSSDLALNPGTRTLQIDCGNTSWQIDGLTGGYAGRKLTIQNASNLASLGTIIPEASSASSSGNRIITPNNENRGGYNRYACELEYDAVDGFWRMVSDTGPQLNSTQILQIRHNQAADSSISENVPTGCTWFEVEGIGGGGGGGGADAEAVKEACAGGGGGAGAWFRHRFQVTSGPITGSIGGGGSAGSNTGGTGGNGGTTFVWYDGTAIFGFGGAGGTGISVGPNANSQFNASVGGLGASGDTNASERADGGDGFPGMMFSVSANACSACGGNGGASYRGSGGRGGSTNSDSGTSSGQAGRAPGSGGGGGARTSTGGASTGATGGTGAPGYMKITFYSGPMPTQATIN